ncbi:MAG: hypothetical protein JNK63_11605 [Chthonomonas sp.]|nr:hypothetical protein [Chthonomonas sp.]
MGIIAALLATHSWAADLNAPELKLSAGYEFRMTPVPVVFAQLRKETGLEISLDPKLSKRRITALVTNQPRNQFMLRMADVLGAKWMGLRMVQRDELAKFDKDVIEKNLAASKKLMLADLFAMQKESDRPYSEILNEHKLTEQAMSDLRRDRPEGWGDRFTKLSRRVQVLSPFAYAPSLYGFLRVTRDLPAATWQQMVEGRRISAWVPQEGLAGGKWETLFGDPTSGNAYFSGRPHTPVIDAFDWPKTERPRSLPLGFGTSITREFKAKDESWRTYPLQPGDLDVLERVHRDFGVDVVMEGLLTRDLYYRLSPSTTRDALNGLTKIARAGHEEMRLDGDWITYVPPRAEVKRLYQFDPDVLAMVEKSGANELAPLVKLMGSVTGPAFLDFLYHRAEVSILPLLDSIELFDFLGMLTPAQLNEVARGRAISYTALSPMAKNLFREFAVTGEKSSKGSAELDKDLLLDPFGWDKMYFYFERFMEPSFRRPIGDGKTITGNVNDGVAQSAGQKPTYFVELNFYFGVNFATSMKRSVRMETLVPPPLNKPDPNAKPPVNHEGHGPGL